MNVALIMNHGEGDLKMIRQKRVFALALFFFLQKGYSRLLCFCFYFFDQVPTVLSFLSLFFDKALEFGV